MSKTTQQKIETWWEFINCSLELRPIQVHHATAKCVFVLDRARLVRQDRISEWSRVFADKNEAVLDEELNNE